MVKYLAYKGGIMSISQLTSVFMENYQGSAAQGLKEIGKELNVMPVGILVGAVTTVAAAFLFGFQCSRTKGKEMPDIHLGAIPGVVAILAIWGTSIGLGDAGKFCLDLASRISTVSR
jgi:hypothetical protein